MNNEQQNTKETASSGYEFVTLTKESWSYEDFKRYLTLLSDWLPMPEKRMPVRIDTGKIGDELSNLVTTTKEDPKKRERGKFIIVNPDKQLQVQSNASVGTYESVKTSARIETRVNSSMPQYSESSTVLGVMHTHPIDTPPTFTDLKQILVNPENGGCFLMMVGTPNIKLLFLRTMETENVPKEEIDPWGEKMKQNYFQEISKLSNRNEEPLVLNKIIGEICENHKITAYSSIDGNTFTKAKLN